MAIFNPQLQTPNDPSYLKYSQGVEDKTFETLLKGIGGIAGSAVTGADTVVKQKLREEAENLIEPAREGFTKSYELAKTLVSGRAPGGADDASSGILNFSEEEQARTPQALKQGIKTVGGIEAAKANGKLSESEYYMKLESIAKHMRNKYPGYREYIDKEISEIVGGTPANMYWRSLQSDLNSYATGKDKAKEDALTFMRSERVMKHAGADRMYREIASGARPPEDAYTFANPLLHQEYDLDMQKKARENRQGSNVESKDRAIDELNDKGSAIVKNWWHKLQLTPGIPNIAALHESAIKIMKGELPPPDQTQVDQFAAAIRAQKDLAVRELMDHATQGKNGRSILKDLKDPEELNKRVSAIVAPFDRLAEMVSTNRWDLAAEATNSINSMIADTKKRLYTHETLGRTMQLSTAMKDVGGEAFQRKFTEQFLVDGKLGEYKTLIANEAKTLAVQPDIRTKGLYTVQDAINKLRANNVKVPETYSKFIDFISNDVSASDVADPAKLNGYSSVFDPKNRNLIQTFGREGVDDQGNKIKGQYYVFRQLTNQTITDDIKRLKNTELTQNYRNWGEETFNQLFSREIADFNSVIASKNNQIVWDSENKQWYRIDMLKHIKDPVERARAMSDGANVRQNQFIDRTLNRLNMGLTNMQGVAKTIGITGGDVDVYLLNILQQKGVQLTTGGTAEGAPLPGIPELMSKAIINSREKDKNKKKDWNVE